MNLKVNLDRNLEGFHLKAAFEIDSDRALLFGRSGAGKTSVLRAIAGVDKSCCGRIEYRGEVIFDSDKKIYLQPHKRKIGMMFQSARLFPHMSVAANLEYGYNRIPQSARRITPSEMADALGISHLLRARPRVLSGGEARRVALGRLLLSAPNLLLLDEPFTGLDASLKLMCINLLREYRDISGAGMLIVSHLLDEVLPLTDWIMIIDEGRIMIEGEYHKVLASGADNEVLWAADPPNIISAKIVREITSEGKTCFEVETTAPGNGSVRTIELLGPSLGDVNSDGRVILSLKPDDIVLALNPVADSDFDNRLPGRIISFRKTPKGLMALLDCGLNLHSLIDRSSAERLDLKAGSDIWCHFRASALRRLG